LTQRLEGITQVRIDAPINILSLSVNELILTPKFLDLLLNFAGAFAKFNLNNRWNDCDLGDACAGSLLPRSGFL